MYRTMPFYRLLQAMHLSISRQASEAPYNFGRSVVPHVWRSVLHNFLPPVLRLDALSLLKIYPNYKFLLSFEESLCYNKFVVDRKAFPFYSVMSLLPAGAFFCNAINSFTKAIKRSSFSEFPLFNSSHICSNTFDNRNDI